MILKKINDDILGELVVQGEELTKYYRWAKRETIEEKEVWVYFDIYHYSDIEDSQADEVKQESLELRKILKKHYIYFLKEKDDIYINILYYCNAYLDDLELDYSINKDDIVINEVRFFRKRWAVVFELEQSDELYALEYDNYEDEKYDISVCFEEDIDVVSFVDI